MLRPLFRFMFVLVSIAAASVIAARTIGDAQPPRAWLTWEGVGVEGIRNDVFVFDGRRSVNITHTPLRSEVQAVWSQDGRLAWIASGDVFVLEGGHIHNVTQYDLDHEFAFLEMPLQWSAEGWLAWVTLKFVGRTLSVWDGEQIQVVSEFPSEYYTSYTWTAEGDLIWYTPAVEGARIQVWDGETVRVIEEMADENQHRSDSGAPVWVSHEGGHQSVRTWDGTQVITLHTGGMWDSVYAWSTDGQLAWLDEHGEIKVWDGDRVQIVPPLENTQLITAVPPVWSPDGRLTWIAQVGYTPQNIIAVFDGETTLPLVETVEFSIYLSWSADGRLAWVTSYFPGTKGHVWDGAALVSFDLPGIAARAPVWSADGRLGFVTRYESVNDRAYISVWDGMALVTLSTTAINAVAQWSPPID